MAVLTDFDLDQLYNRLKIPVTVLRWALHAGLVPPADLPSGRWSRPVVEALDRQALLDAVPGGAITGGAAADRIAAALGTPNVPGERKCVTTFTVRRLIALGLLTELSASDKGSLVNPAQVAQVCTRADLAQLAAAESPLGPEQAAARLGIRRVDFDHLVRLRLVAPAEYVEVEFGRSRAGAVEVPLYRTASIDALPAAHPEVDFEALRGLGKGQRSPLAALT